MKIKMLFTAGVMLTFLAASAAIAQTGKVKYGTGKWNPDLYGNHRAVVSFNGDGDCAGVTIPWRRKDTNPEKKRIIIVSESTGKEITNVKTVSVTRESGTILFEPVSGKGNYFVYYLPYKDEGKSNYPKGIYLEPKETASAVWLKSAEGKKASEAICTELQSVDSFNSFYPMEVIATQEETARLLNPFKDKSFVVIPEDREYPIKMEKDFPIRWAENGIRKSYTGNAAKGEYFTFQLGLYANKNISDAKINFTALKGKSESIPAKSITCFNAEGISYDAKQFAKKINVEQGVIQPLWIGIDIPANIKEGLYEGTVEIKAGSEKEIIPVEIKVNSQIAENGGIDKPWLQTRLKWLNSTLAQKNDVIPPYTPIEVDGKQISLLGRKVKLAASGLPEKIQTFISEEMTSYVKEPKEVISTPFKFAAIDEKGEVNWKNKNFRFTAKDKGNAKWESQSSGRNLSIKVNGSIEFDGFCSFEIILKAEQDVDLKDISLEIPFNKESAKYIMGLGLKGSSLPESYDWKWDVAKKNQDGAWIGDVNGGLQFNLKDENYVRPLNTNFYLQKPLILPSSWGNNGRGGISINRINNSVVAKNFSGPRKMKKGEVLHYNLTLLITPFHTINTDFQFSTRFFHKYKPVDSVKATGATVINIHHANEINPYINYPFIAFNEMKSYIDEAHAKGLKVKIYNTVRELSNRAYELFPLKSLGTEIYSAGNGGGFSWLQEHVANNYIAAWFVPELKDAAIINSGMSRWHNYYVEGMNWLVKNAGIDGIYLDDVAFDRITMKRIKRVLTQNEHPGIIDLHSANQYNTRDGFINSAVLYMEHFPYLNRLWFGEYFDYENNSPDFFLTEISGIPFGLMGEMLQNGGNPWRGMIYGMTNRMPWSDDADPRPLWKLWDEFGIKDSKMIGYWVESNPVKTDNNNVLATVYKKDSAVLVSLASWNSGNTSVKLNVNWKSLGINPDKAVITAPGINKFQPARTFAVGEEIPVEKNKGWLLIIKEK